MATYHLSSNSNYLLPFGIYKTLISKEGDEVYTAGNYSDARFQNKPAADFIHYDGAGAFVSLHDTSGVLKWVVRSTENGSLGVDDPVSMYDIALHPNGGLVATGSALDCSHCRERWP